MEDCGQSAPDRFEFAGYDLLDKDYSVSALSNCSGLDEMFLPSELNETEL